LHGVADALLACKISGVLDGHRGSG
jgi:hypothetical protein